MIEMGKNLSGFGKFENKPYYILILNDDIIYTHKDKYDLTKTFNTEKQLLSYYNRFKKPKYKHKIKGLKNE